MTKQDVIEVLEGLSRGIETYANNPKLKARFQEMIGTVKSKDDFEEDDNVADELGNFIGFVIFKEQANNEPKLQTKKLEAEEFEIPIKSKHTEEITEETESEFSDLEENKVKSIFNKVLRVFKIAD